VAVIRNDVVCSTLEEYQRALAYAEAAPGLIEVAGDEAALTVRCRTTPDWTPPPLPTE
jgi:hypothetical protein